MIEKYKNIKIYILTFFIQNIYFNSYYLKLNVLFNE
uniref:Uncharacterized protein n=1 Tax=viral metagenome TaxID=1070528 RepID=A0A6C0ICU4_9ZZZZ